MRGTHPREVEVSTLHSTVPHRFRMRAHDRYDRPQGRIVEDETLAASHRVPVLISAPCRTTVQSIATRIHGRSATRMGPFVRISAATLNAIQDQFAAEWASLVRRGHGGSVFVENIEELGTAGQDQLLRELLTSPGVRVISGTTAALHERVATGAFSATLFYRLNIIHLVVS